MKKALSLLLASVMLLSLGVCAMAEELPEEEPALTGADAQIAQMAADFSSFRQDGDVYYAVTDLDRNGCLELIAAPKNGGSIKAIEMTEDGTAFTECTVNIPDGESFPEIVMENADTYYDAASGTWFYMFSESFTGDSLFSSAKCAVSFKNGAFSYSVFARESTEIINGYVAITYTDNEGNIITPEEYNAAGVNNFAGCEKSSTNLGWFKAGEETEAIDFTDSYMVFTGEKDPSPLIPEEELLQFVQVGVPADTQLPATTEDGLEIVMVDTTGTNYSVPTGNTGVATTSGNGYLRITKNPTNENRAVGGTARFIAIAENYSSLVWTFVDPYGGEYSAQGFGSMFPYASISGSNGLTLDIGNVSEGMAGWGTYCTFYGNGGQSARTNTAYISIKKQSSGPSSSSKRATGYVTDYLMSTVTIRLENGTYVQVLKDICSITGSLTVGAPCDVYYSGSTPNSSNVTWVSVQGYTPVYDTPVYNGGPGTVVIKQDDPYKNK